MGYNSDSKNIIKDFLFLSGSRYFGEFLFILKGIAVVSLLGPALYGVWTVIKIILAFTEYTCFGALRGMVREVPISAANKDDALQKTHAAGFTVGFIVALVISLGIFLFSYLPLSANFYWEIKLTSIIFILGYIFYYSKLKLQSENKIKSFSSYQFIYALSATVTGILFTYLWSLKGLLISIIITYLIVNSMLIFTNVLSFKINFDRSLTKKLINVGSPILIITLLLFLMFRLDSLIVYYFVGAKEAGYYGLAILIIVMINHIPGSLAQVLFPKLMFHYGKSITKKELESYYIKPLQILTIIISIILSIVFFNIDYIVNEFLSKYTASIPVIKILLGSLFFSSLLTIPINILIAINKHSKITFVGAFIILIQFSFDLVLLKQGYGFESIAYVSLAMFAIFSLIVNSYTLHLLGRNNFEVFTILSKFISPFIYSAFLVFIISYYVNYTDSIIVVNILLQIFLYMIGMFPVVLYYIKKNPLPKFKLSLSKN